MFQITIRTFPVVDIINKATFVNSSIEFVKTNEYSALEKSIHLSNNIIL
jgi:hypothetical protein